MKEAIKILHEFGIKKTEEELKKWKDIPENLTSEKVIKDKKEKLEEFKHAIRILRDADDFYESFKNIE